MEINFRLRCLRASKILPLNKTDGPRTLMREDWHKCVFLPEPGQAQKIIGPHFYRFDFPPFHPYNAQMKALFKLASAIVLVSGLCSCESEIPSNEPGIGEKFQRGIRGQGTLYVPDQELDASSSPAR